MDNTKSLLFVYEPAQVPHVAPLEGQTIVALDAEVELDLKKRNIPFVSLAALAVSPQDDRALLEHTRKLALEWYSAPDMAFFEHDGIKLGEQYEVVVLYYIQTVFYWTAVLGQVLDKHREARSASVFETFMQVPPTADPTARFKERAVVDVLHLLCERHGMVCTVLPAPLVQRGAGVFEAWRIKLSQRAARIASAVWNAAVSALLPRRALVLFATDPWVRLAPFVEHMRDLEIVMSRRQEMPAMLPGAAWRSRARYNHRLDFAGRAVRVLARERAGEIARRWDALGESPSISKGFVYNGISLWPVVRPALDHIVRDCSGEAIQTIESTKRLFIRRGVNCVLLFASTKGYNNLVARIAERMDIPSIELQHALVNNEKSLVHCRLNSRYLASYGPIINRTYESWGVEPWRLVSVGSPRFDRHATPVPPAVIGAMRAKLSLTTERLTVLWGMPQVYYSLEYGNYTSYEVLKIMGDVAAVGRKASWHILLRPRSGLWRGSFYQREETRGLFPPDTRMVQEEDLRVLLAACDVVLTGTSTVVLEAMLMHKPVLLYIPKQLDNDLREFWESGAVLMARTKEELAAHAEHLARPENRAALVARADEFVRSNFVLEGGSATRVQGLLRDVAGVLEGARVRLEPLAPRHISEEYRSWFSDKETTRYNRHGAGLPLSELKAYVDKVGASNEDAVFAVVDRETAAHIGNIALQKMRGREAEFAILIGNARYRGRGYAREATKLLLHFGFERLGLERVYCSTPVQHESMRALAERLGFVEKGVREGAMQKGAERWDIVDYELRERDLRS